MKLVEINLHTGTILLISALLLIACTHKQPLPIEQSFTIAVIPDTQNYVDFTLQKAEGFPIDSSELFIQQMRHIANKGIANGGDVAFVASVGDVWQHMLRKEDPEHTARGIVPAVPARVLDHLIYPEETLNIEIPKAIEGYQLISEAGIPFGVAPGNHDYDAIWLSMIPGIEPPRRGRPPSKDMGIQLGGFDAFRSAFGNDTSFFKGKEWYIDSYDGGSNSAQVFTAAGYQFLHLAFEMHAGDHVLNWAQAVLDRNPGIPTLISTHDFLNASGERLPGNRFMDLPLTDPEYNNSSEQIWQKFIRQNDQILMVLSGHQLGQALRVDDNASGHKVYQLLADYQARGQVGLDAGVERNDEGGIVGLGDGWYREMTFHFDSEFPHIEVKTFSTYYESYSGEIETYAQWYRPVEQPEMTDIEFYQADDFIIHLEDFYERFGPPNSSRRAR